MDFGLEEALRQGMKVQGPTSLEAALGAATKVPLGVELGRRQQQKKAALNQLLMSGGLPEGLVPDNADEALKEAQAKGIFNKPDIAQMTAAMREAVAQGNRDAAAARQDKQIAAQDRRQEKALQNKPLSADAAKMIANMDSGVDSINKARMLLSSGRGKTLQMKAGSPFPRFASLGDQDAQRLRKHVMETVDILTRGRTGAALNNQELEQYGTQILNWADNIDVAQEMLDKYEKFFRDTKENLQRGRIQQGDMTPQQFMENEVMPALRPPATGAAPAQGATGMTGTTAPPPPAMAQAPGVKVQRNKKTGQVRMSRDGGKTWSTK